MSTVWHRWRCATADLFGLFKASVDIPSGLPLELERWLTICTAVDIVGARLERMRALLQSKEDKCAETPSSSHGAYCVPAHCGSLNINGVLWHHQPEVHMGA